MGKLERKMKRRQEREFPTFAGMKVVEAPTMPRGAVRIGYDLAKPGGDRTAVVFHQPMPPSYLLYDEASDPSASVWAVDWADRRSTSLATEYPPLPPSRPILELMQEAMALMDKPSWIDRRERVWLGPPRVGKSMLHYDLAEAVSNKPSIERKPPNPRPWLDPAPQDYPPAAECSVAGELARLADGEPHNWHSPLRTELISDGLIEPVWRSNLWVGDKITTKGRKRLK